MLTKGVKNLHFIIRASIFNICHLGGGHPPPISGLSRPKVAPYQFSVSTIAQSHGIAWIQFTINIYHSWSAASACMIELQPAYIHNCTSRLLSLLSGPVSDFSLLFCKTCFWFFFQQLVSYLVNQNETYINVVHQ